MRIITLIILVLTFLTSCSKKNECGNRFDFITTNDSIPILKLDYSEDAESRLEKMNNLYGIDLCEICSWVEFKMPFKIEGENGYLKLMADFNYPYCPNCPIAIIIRNHFGISVNSNNQILAQGNLVLVDSLKTEIKNYLSKVGEDDDFPESFERVKYYVNWNKNSDSKFIESIFTCIYSTHTEFIASKLSDKGTDFCSLDIDELNKLKMQYPIKIQINSGKSIEMPSPAQMENLRKYFEEDNDLK